MVINDVIGLELDNKCMSNRINELGVHDDIYAYVYVMCALCMSSFACVQVVLRVKTC